MECPRCQPAGSDASPYRADTGTGRRRPPLTDHPYEGDIVVQRCERCDGLWLTDAQLRAIQDTRINTHGGALPETVPMRWARDANAGPEELTQPCPSCGDELFATTYKRSNVPYFRCLGCRGVFVDEPALRDIEVLWESVSR